MNINSYKIHDIYQNIYEIDKNGRKIDLYKFDKVTFSGINMYYPNILMKSNDTVYLPLLEKTMSLNMTTIYEKYDMKYDWIDNKINNLYKEPVFFFVYNTENYYHFLYDTLPYLISFYEIKKEIPNIKLLIQYPNSQKAELYLFVKEFYEILGIIDDIIFIDKNTEYTEVYISTSYTHDIDSNLPPRKEIYNFYKSIVDKVKNNNIITPKKIYISRRTWTHNNITNIGTNYTIKRRLMNEDELVKYLNCIGYVEVFTENMTTIEKIFMFSNATHIVGAIGGGIANVLFSNENTKLTAIISPTFLEINRRFIYSLSNIKLLIYNYTSHYDTGEFKKYMRVSKDNIVGEVEEIYDTTLLISYTDGSNTGWNSECKYNKLIVNKNEVIKLDKGLNSPWLINNIELIQ